MALRFLPPLEYNITRPFHESAWVTASTYVVALFSCIALCIVNVALVGYDPTTVFHSNFNVTQSFWYDRLIPFINQTPGTLCDAHVFNVGDSLVTNTSLFEWKVEAVFRPNAGESGFSYTGGTMDACDVMQISFNADMRTWSLEGSMYMYCGTLNKDTNKDTPEMAAVASFGISGLPARQTNFQRMAKSAEQDTSTWTIGNLLSLAGIDIGSRIWEAYLNSNDTGVVAYSVLANFEFCPPALAFPLDASPPHPCGLTPPQLLDFTAVTTILANNTIIPSITLVEAPAYGTPDTPAFNLDDTIYSPTANFVHIARAAARIDLGNTAPNNFLTNPQLVDRVLASEFPATPLTTASASQAYTAWKSQINPLALDAYPALRVSGPSTLQAVFICHFIQLKSAGSLVVSVLVATLSVFSSGWGLTLMAAAYFWRSGEEDNFCQGHESERRLSYRFYVKGREGLDSDRSVGRENDTPISDSNLKLNWEPLLSPRRSPI